MEFPKKITEALQRERPFPLARYASEAWKLTFDNKSSYIGAMFTYMALFFVAAIVMGIVMAIFGGGMGTMLDPMAQPSGTQLVIQFLLTIVLMLFIIPMPAGFAQAAHSATNERSIPFNDFFAGYRSGKWGNLIITGLVLALISYLVLFVAILLIGAPFAFALQEAIMMGGNSEALPYIFGVVAGIMAVMLAIRAVYMWSTHVTYFFDKRGWTALEASRRLIGWNFGWVILFDFLVILGVIAVMAIAGFIMAQLGMIGIILFFFVYLFVLLMIIPFFLNFQYVSFADAVRLNDVDNDGQPDEDRIIDHFMPE